MGEMIKPLVRKTCGMGKLATVYLQNTSAIKGIIRLNRKIPLPGKGG